MLPTRASISQSPASASPGLSTAQVLSTRDREPEGSPGPCLPVLDGAAASASLATGGSDRGSGGLLARSRSRLVAGRIGNLGGRPA